MATPQPSTSQSPSQSPSQSLQQSPPPQTSSLDPSQEHSSQQQSHQQQQPLPQHPIDSQSQPQATHSPSVTFQQPPIHPHPSTPSSHVLLAAPAPTSPAILQIQPRSTQSMSDEAKSQQLQLTQHQQDIHTSQQQQSQPDPPKLFTYQASKDAKDDKAPGDDDWVVLQATPSDKRYESEIVHVQVSKADAAYNLKPIHCGRKVVFLNAQDPNFYRRELRNPNLMVWILCGMNIMQSHGLKRLFESGWRQNIQVRVMETNKFELIASKDGLENILYEGGTIDLPDAIIVRVGANVDYFGLAVLRHLENMGCLIFNKLASIEISRDKLLTVQHLAGHGLPIPKTVLSKFPVSLETLKREFEYPIIIKKASGSQGKGIIKVDTHEQMEDLVDMLDTGKPVIFQEYIRASSGKDLRVFVIGGRVVGAMMRIAAKGNFKANVHQGGTVKPVKLSPQVEWLVLETVKIVGLDIAGVDLLIDKNTYKVCEVNSSPGFEGLEKALGENIAIKMFQYMKMRLGVWRRKSTSTKSSSRVGVTVPVQSEHITSSIGSGATPDENGAPNGVDVDEDEAVASSGARVIRHRSGRMSKK